MLRFKDCLDGFKFLLLYSTLMICMYQDYQNEIIQVPITGSGSIVSWSKRHYEELSATVTYQLADGLVNRFFNKRILAYS